MIISKFNRYVEKHGRVTYIILGIIICLAFVVFVTPDAAGRGGCSGRGGIKTMGKMFGKNISLDEFLQQRNMADLTCFMRYNILLSQYNEQMLNQETYNRIRTVRAAKKQGYYKKITDAEIAKNIQGNPLFREDGKFSVTRFNAFKSNLLASFNMKAADFDEMIRQNLAVAAMQDAQTEGVSVTEDEVEAEIAEYTIASAEVKRDNEKAVTPSQAEIEDFFAKRKAEIVPDKLRSALLASFPIAAYANAIEVRDADIKRVYDAQKNGIYKGQTLEQVKSQIAKQLKDNGARAAMRKDAVDLIEKLTKQTAGLDAKAAVAKAQELLKGSKATVKVTALFAGDNVPDAGNASRAIGRAAAALNKPGEVAKNPVLTPSEATLVMLADIKNGVVSEKLDAATSEKIKEMIISEKALAFFKEKIAPYRATAAGTQSFWQLASKQQAEIQADTTMDSAAKQNAMIELSDFIREYVAPFYHEEQRAFTVATFKPADYVKEVVLTEADIKNGFNARSDEYGKVEVKLERITVKFENGASAEAKAAKKARIEAANAKLVSGTDFAAVAKEYSEDKEDAKLVDVKSLDEAIAKQVEGMTVGQISPVVETADAYSIVKLAERKGPRTFEEVRVELTKALTEEAAKKAAQDDAGKLRSEVLAKLSPEVETAAALATFKAEAALHKKANVTDVPSTVRNNRLANGAAADASFMYAVFGTSMNSPCTDVVTGKDAIYVACLSEIKPAYLEDKNASDAVLRNVYSKYMGNEANKKEASELCSKINEALKGGKDLKTAASPLEFKTAATKLTSKNAATFRDIPVRNIYGMTADLAKAQVNTLIAPQKGISGYYLVHLENKQVPKVSDDEKKEIREQLLNQKKSEKLNEFYMKLERESNLTDVPDFINKKR